MEEQLFSNAMQGWQCPICKRVYSPFTAMCPYCGGNNEIQTTTSFNIEEFVEGQSSNFRNKTTK